MNNLTSLQPIANAHLRHRRCHNVWQRTLPAFNHKSTKPPYNVTFRVLRGFVRRSDGTEAHGEQFTVKYLQRLHTALSRYGNAIWATGWCGVGCCTNQTYCYQIMETWHFHYFRSRPQGSTPYSTATASELAPSVRTHQGGPSKCSNRLVNISQHIGHYIYHTVVTMYRTVVTVPHSGHCTAQWSLYVPPSGHYMYRTVVTICTTSITFNNSTFSPHTVFMCFVWISEQTAIISLYNIN